MRDAVLVSFGAIHRTSLYEASFCGRQADLDIRASLCGGPEHAPGCTVCLPQSIGE